MNRTSAINLGDSVLVEKLENEETSTLSKTILFLKGYYSESSVNPDLLPSGSDPFIFTQKVSTKLMAINLACP